MIPSVDLTYCVVSHVKDLGTIETKLQVLY